MKFVVLLTSLWLIGCTNYDGKVWVKRGQTHYDFIADDRDCKSQIYTAQGGWAHMNEHDYLRYDLSLHELDTCLKIKGYTLESYEQERDRILKENAMAEKGSPHVGVETSRVGY